MIITEVKKNLFTVDKKYILAHCISEDAKMGAGIAVDFNKKFKLSALQNMDLKVGMAKFHNNVFNLITKSKYYGKPTYDTITQAIEDMKQQCLEHNIKYLAMPKIGCGLDRLSWGKVREIIENSFEDTDVEILVCSL